VHGSALKQIDHSDDAADSIGSKGIAQTASLREGSANSDSTLTMA
jgi:hypothetical protein